MALTRDHDLHRRRARRNLAVGLCLLSFVALVFVITMVKISNGDSMEAFDHAVRPSLTVEEEQ